MADLMRYTVFGHFLRLVSRGKLLPWAEQMDSPIVKKYMLVMPEKDEKTPTSTGPNSNTGLSAQDVGHLVSDSASTLTSTTSPERDAGTRTDIRADQEKGQDLLLVEFAVDDPENPRNWSTVKKFFVTFEICLLTTSVYIGSAIYTAGLLGVVEDFGVSQVAAILGLTLFVLGYATGPMIWAPMSEMPYFGRTSVYIGTLFAFVLLQLGVIYAKNFGMLLAFRFITGFVGSPVLATGGATIADMYVPKKQVYGIGVWGIAAVFGPAMGPLIGGFAAENKGWTWTIWELMWLSGACLVFLVFFLPETSSANILYRRTRRLRKLTGNDTLKCQPEIDAEGMTANEAVMMTLVRPFTLSFTEPICFALNLYLALIYALLYCWFESFPLVFVDIYHFNLGTLGLAFLGILVGALVVMPPFFWYTHRYTEPRFHSSPATGDNDVLRPIELRLQPAFVGAFLVPVCLFWFGWSSRPSVHWIVPVVGSSLFSMGAFLLFMAVLSYLGDAYPDYVASVYAGNDLMRSSFGAAFPLFATAMYKRLGVGWASSLLGFLSVLFIPIPFILYYYGERIRGRSRMAKHD